MGFQKALVMSMMRLLGELRNGLYIFRTHFLTILNSCGLLSDLFGHLSQLSIMLLLCPVLHLTPCSMVDWVWETTICSIYIEGM
jgi:hypothetical protein